jgi:hypothetical protein
VPEQQLGGRQLLAERHHYVARLERAAGRSGQQRRVEHEVDVVDQGDLRGLVREATLEPTGGGEPCEAAAENEDVPGHA